MNRKQFHVRLKEILAANQGPYNSPNEEFHQAMDRQVEGLSGGRWDEDVALRVINQFEVLTGTKPKSIEIPESEIKKIFGEFLLERGYKLTQIPEDKSKTPDSYIEGFNSKYICEIKSPEAVLDPDTQLYKFKTTHRKILDFIHTAIKQFESLDSEHTLPRVLVFTSITMQLNWKSFTDAIQGGVIDHSGVALPDFSKTPVYTSTLPLLKDVDLFVWYQVSGGGDRFYQASYFVNSNSSFLKESKELISQLSQPKLSTMDNAFELILT